jgi:hypothetical protein
LPSEGEDGGSQPSREPANTGIWVGILGSAQASCSRETIDAECVDRKERRPWTERRRSL